MKREIGKRGPTPPRKGTGKGIGTVTRVLDAQYLTTGTSTWVRDELVQEIGDGALMYSCRVKWEVTTYGKAIDGWELEVRRYYGLRCL